MSKKREKYDLKDCGSCLHSDMGQTTPKFLHSDYGHTTLKFAEYHVKIQMGTVSHITMCSLYI